MSDNSKREFASTLKWIAVIIFATVVYSKNISHNFYFTKHGQDLLRGNTHTGKMEYLDDHEWIDLAESQLEQELRLERKKIQDASAKRIKKTLAKKKSEQEKKELDALCEEFGI